MLMKLTKKIPSILINKSDQIKELLNSFTDQQLLTISDIFEIDVNKLKEYRQYSSNIANEVNDISNNVSRKGSEIANTIDSLTEF